jgi:hypothetical protein
LGDLNDQGYVFSARASTPNNDGYICGKARLRSRAGTNLPRAGPGRRPAAWLFPTTGVPEDAEPVADTDDQMGMAIPLTAFAAGAVVALLVGVFGTLHDPSPNGLTTLGFDTVIGMKVVVSTLIGVLAVLQVIGALWIYGKLGIRAPSWLGTAHRIGGTVALVLTVFVAYHCLWALGLESGTLEDGEKVPTRTVVHGVLGCAVVGAIVVKVVAVRSRRAPGWFLPLAGGLLFALLVVVVLTSAGWYLGEKGWPTSGGYR